MKHLFLSVIILCAFAFTADAQRQYLFTAAEDTLTNAETAYIYPADAASALATTNLREYGANEVTIKYDSLSGNPAGTAVLQYCYDEGCTYTYDAATVTLNGATQVVTRTALTDFTPIKWRVKMTTTGTQTCRVQVLGGWKRRT